MVIYGELSIQKQDITSPQSNITPKITVTESQWSLMESILMSAEWSSIMNGTPHQDAVRLESFLSVMLQMNSKGMRDWVYEK